MLHYFYNVTSNEARRNCAIRIEEDSHKFEQTVYFPDKKCRSTMRRTIVTNYLNKIHVNEYVLVRIEIAKCLLHV